MKTNLKFKTHLISEWRKVKKSPSVTMNPKFKKLAKKNIRKRVRLELKREINTEWV